MVLIKVWLFFSQSSVQFCSSHVLQQGKVWFSGYPLLPSWPPATCWKDAP